MSTKKDVSFQNKKLNKISNIFTDQTSPQNPFGPNYKELDYNTKVRYKYAMMKQFFKFSEKDQTLKNIEQQKFLGTLILGFVSGYYFVQVPSLIYQKLTKKILSIHGRFFSFIFAMSISSTLGYKIANDRYTEKVSKYFINKYIGQAVQNGFTDYQIS